MVLVDHKINKFIEFIGIAKDLLPFNLHDVKTYYRKNRTLYVTLYNEDKYVLEIRKLRK